MYSKTPLILTSLLLVLGGTTANAQSSTDAAVTQQELQLANEMVKTMRNMTIIANLEFTPEENEKFWPLYRLRGFSSRNLHHAFNNAVHAIRLVHDDVRHAPVGIGHITGLLQ